MTPYIFFRRKFWERSDALLSSRSIWTGCRGASSGCSRCTAGTSQAHKSYWCTPRWHWTIFWRVWGPSSCLRRACLARQLTAGAVALFAVDFWIRDGQINCFKFKAPLLVRRAPHVPLLYLNNQLACLFLVRPHPFKYYREGPGRWVLWSTIPRLVVRSQKEKLCRWSKTGALGLQQRPLRCRERFIWSYLF